jgi:hypothetical protein
MIERRADMNSFFYTYLSLTFFLAASIFLTRDGTIKLWRRDPKILPSESVRKELPGQIGQLVVQDKLDKLSALGIKGL